MKFRLKIKAGGNQYRLAKLISAAAVSLSVVALPALAGEAPPTGHGGSGVISGNNCFKTNSKTITEVCADYKVSWKLWTLMGEPVGDYRLKWELSRFIIHGGKAFNSYVFGNDIPQVLAKETQSIELYLDAIASVGLGTAAYLQQPLAFHAFNTGVAIRAGQLSYNTPGSPRWDQVFQRGWGFGGGAVSENERHLSESEAKDIFKRSNQPDVPIQLFNLQIGPKSSVMELGALESRIAQLCANPDTAPSYAFCPAIKKPEEKKADKKNPIEDAFADLEKTKPVVPPKPISSVKDKTAKADKVVDDKVVDDGFADVDAHRAKPVSLPEARDPLRVEPIAQVAVTQVVAETDPHTQFGEAGGLTWVWFKPDKSKQYVRNNHGGLNNTWKFSAVENYCQTEIGGQSGWRLPTISELDLLHLTSMDSGYVKDEWDGAWDSVVSSDVGPSDKYGGTHMGWKLSYREALIDGIETYSDWMCVHTSLASNNEFTKTHKICHTKNECKDPK